MKRELKPGMRVFLRSDLKHNELYGSVLWEDDMIKGEWVDVGVICPNNTFKIRDENYYFNYHYSPEMIDWNMMELDDMIDFIQDKHESNNNEPEDLLFQLIKRAYKAMEDGLLQIEDINYNDNEVIVRTNYGKRITLIPFSLKTDVFFHDLHNPQEVKITDRETFEDIVENHTILQVTLQNGSILDRDVWNYLWINIPVGIISKILQDATVKIGRK